MTKQSKNIQKEKNVSEIIERLVSVNRVSKTVKGGKNMSFSALVIVGDKNGRVGFGKGNATEVSDAKNKAFEAAKKAMIKVSLNFTPIHKFRPPKQDYLRVLLLETNILL
jgi:small subunit ribosomal protein S5